MLDDDAGPSPSDQARDAGQDLAVAATLPAPGPDHAFARFDVPVPSLQGVADLAERDRVFEARLEVPAEQQRLGRYVVVGTLGRGAMGTVLEAFDAALDRRVAVKVLHRVLGERHRARLIGEAQALAKLSHPNVVHVYEVGEAEGQVFIAMELVRGCSLADWLELHPRPEWRACVHAFVQAGEGLAAAHAAGLVHRDFKPDNAVIDGNGRVRVLDFGLVWQAEDVAQDERATTSTALAIDDVARAASLTETGTVLGTLAYMPLEQMAGERADARSDQFSFCVSLYEALYGERPFEGNSMAALMLALEVGKLRPAPKVTAVPEALRKVVLRGLASKSSERWPSMEALLVELRRLVAPRRRGWRVLALAGGLAAIGVVLAQYAEVGFRCEGAQAQLEGIWDETRRQEVKDAILGTGLSYAPDTWERVEQRLDEHARAWVDKHTEVCEATSVRHEQSADVMDLRMECLRGRRVALRKVVGVLAEADEARVEKAVEVVAGLPRLSRCDDVEVLAAQLPPPEDPQLAVQVEAARERLAQVKALQDAGAYDEARAEAETVVELAEGLSYPPLLADALLWRGRTRDTGDHVEAEKDLEQAFLLAAEHGYDAIEAEAAAWLTSVVGSSMGRAEAGQQWGRTALALAKSPKVERTVEAIALQSMGSVLVSAKKFEEGLSYGQQGLAITERELGADTPEFAVALASVGSVLGEIGEYEGAIGHLRRATGILESTLGPGHPKLGTVLMSTGFVLQRQRRLEDALVVHRRALAILEAALGPRHLEVGLSYAHIGIVLEERGELEEAIDYQRRALAVYEAALGAEHGYCANPLLFIGAMLTKQGKLEEALIHLRRSLAIDEARYGPDHIFTVAALDSIGEALTAQGELEAARTYHQRALVLRERLGPRQRSVPVSLLGLARVALAEHAFDEARAYAERSVSIAQENKASSGLLADARFVLAQALWPDRSQRAFARTLVEQARDTYAERGDVEIRKLEAWLAEHPVPSTSE